MQQVSLDPLLWEIVVQMKLDSLYILGCWNSVCLMEIRVYKGKCYKQHDDVNVKRNVGLAWTVSLSIYTMIYVQMNAALHFMQLNLIYQPPIDGATLGYNIWIQWGTIKIQKLQNIIKTQLSLLGDL